MNKNELVNAVAEKALVTKKEAETCINAAIAAVTDALQKGDNLTLVGFGSLSVAKRTARTVKSPQGQTTKIPAHNGVKFKAGSLLKQAVNTKPAKGKK